MVAYYSNKKKEKDLKQKHITHVKKTEMGRQKQVVFKY